LPGYCQFGYGVFGGYVDIANVAALQLDVGGPRDLSFTFSNEHFRMCAPYAEMLASLTEQSNVRSLSFTGNPFDYEGDVVPALQVKTLEEFEMDEASISLKDLKLLLKAIGASNLIIVRIEYIRYKGPAERTQFTHLIADALRNNRSITSFYCDYRCRDEDLWKSTIEPYLERNVLASNLDELASETDDELRAALVCHLVESKSDNSDAVFQLLVQNTAVVLNARLNMHQENKLHSPAQEEG
jgi:hypothetical protein